MKGGPLRPTTDGDRTRAEVYICLEESAGFVGTVDEGEIPSRVCDVDSSRSAARDGPINYANEFPLVPEEVSGVVVAVQEAQLSLGLRPMNGSHQRCPG